MAAVVDYRQGDRYPNLQATLRDGLGAPIDLTLAEGVSFHMAKAGQAARVDAAAEVIDAAAGVVRYSWGANDLGEPGLFNADFEIDWGGGTQTVPSVRGDFQVRVTPELA